MRGGTKGLEWGGGTERGWVHAAGVGGDGDAALSVYAKVACWVSLLVRRVRGGHGRSSAIWGGDILRCRHFVLWMSGSRHLLR